MRKSILTILFLLLLLSCNTQPAKEGNKQNSTEMEKKKYRKPACPLSQTDDRCRCGGRGQGELARRGAYGYYRSRPDSREHEQKAIIPIKG